MNTPRPVTPRQFRLLLERSAGITLFTGRRCPGCGAEMVADANYDRGRHEVAIPVTDSRIVLRCQVCDGGAL